MKIALIVSAVLASILVLLALGGISINNSIERKDEAVDAAFGQVDATLQRRFDLIPNLVNTVKGYAKHEESVFVKITEARAQWSAAKTMEEKQVAANAMDKALVAVKAVSEQYPELKANQNFLELQSQLEGTENRITVARHDYNTTVKGFNQYIRPWPASMIAGMKGSQKRKYFEADTAAKQNVRVDFNNQ